MEAGRPMGRQLVQMGGAGGCGDRISWQLDVMRADEDTKVEGDRWRQGDQWEDSWSRWEVLVAVVTGFLGS